MKRFVALLLTTVLAGGAAGYPLVVPSDAKASFDVLEKGALGEWRTIITNRAKRYDLLATRLRLSRQH